MKLRITIASTVVAALAVAVLALFAACESVSLEEVRPQAELFSLSIQTQAGKTIEGVVIPAPIPSREWNNEEYEVAGADFATIPVKTEAETEDVLLDVTISPGAQVRWGIARVGNRPNYFNNTRVRATFDTEDFLYIKVTADDGVTSNYYRFYSVLASPVKELAAISIAGRDANEISLSSGKFRVPPAVSQRTQVPNRVGNNSYMGQIDITSAEALAGALVAAEPQESNATIKYAVATSINAGRNDNFSAWSDTVRRVVKDEQDKDVFQAVETLTFTDGNILLVEVTAQNEADTNYYIFQVTAGRMAGIAKLKFDGVEAMGKGVRNTVWGSIAPGSFASADQPPNGFKIEIELDDPAGRFDYAKIDNISATMPGTYGTEERHSFANKEALAIRVRSARNDVSDTSYYIVQINLLAANFTKQPKSAAYFITSHSLPLTPVDFTYKGDPVHEQRVLVTADSSSIRLDRAIEPLSVVIDRAVTSYQWYESNSWYGGYGFDREGRIYGDPGYGSDVTSSDQITGESNVQDAKNRLGSGLDWDEKYNISIHNGGNNYYRLPVPGRKIENATNATYTPVIDASKRPFNTGFTNSTHYYWVVVTDAEGRTAVSERAAIVAEWGQLWDHGRPAIDDETGELLPPIAKKHHIVDLYAYMESSTAPGLRASPKNINPFKAGNHADKNLIPITFPSGFNIMEYSVVTCQAKFYLADGREWIQNWTQGDFGFATASGETLVLWYNLTNDNATRGLANSGNDPQGSGLTTIPARLEIRPAGTKPIKEMPPFNANGQPTNNGDAQGWFTPYIEVVELRFEGPTRVGQ